MTTFETSIHDFCKSIRVDGRSESTIKAYSRDLKLLAEALEAINSDICLKTVKNLDLIDALDSPKITGTELGKPRSVSSINRIKSATKTFFSWADDQSLIEENPAVKIRTKTVHRRIPVFLTIKEKKALLRELRDRNSKLSFRDRVMIEILLGTGIRLHELVSLDLDDLDLDAKLIRIRGKGDKEQVKFLKSKLRSLLRTYISRHRRKVVTDDSALFLSNWKRRISARQVENRVKFWIQKSGISKSISPHKLRHTFATHLLEQNGNLKLVQKALGHQHLSTTAIYAHVVDDELAEALEQL